MICTLTDGFDAATVERIQARLNEVERDHGVRVLWAVESGSRAWGFPSPDSDYDCRFFYVRRHDDYLSPWRPRDVIETPLDDVLDVNGWDLIKAIRLAARSNATVMEWLRSPLICRGQPAFAEELLDVCRAVVDHDAIRRHYLHVGRAHWNRSGAAEGGKVSLKKLLYAIRPAAALHWTRTLGSPVPPMNLSALLEEAPGRGRHRRDHCPGPGQGGHPRARGGRRPGTHSPVRAARVRSGRKYRRSAPGTGDPGEGVRGLHRPAQAIRTDTRVEISVNDPTIPP